MTTLNSEQGPNPEHRDSSAFWAHNYHFSYQGQAKWALDDINFQVMPGEMCAVWGSSGSGKSTFLNAATGLGAQYFHGKQEGEMFIYGHDVTRAKGIAELGVHYGFVQQQFRDQVLASTVGATVAVGLENQGVPYEEMHARVDSILTLLGIDHLVGKHVNALSGGEQQKVVIAEMLINDPSAMIFDDITSDLDAGAQAQVREIIQDLQRKGKTILISDSSNTQWLKSVSDKSLVLDEGKQVAFGTTDAVLQDQDTAQTAGLQEHDIKFREAVEGSSVIEMRNISYSYGDTRAVVDLTADIKQGSITALVGHNGSGKTTLAKLIAGIYKPQNNGELQVNGVSPAKMKAGERIRSVYYLHQHPASNFLNDTVTKELEYSSTAAGIYPMIGLDQLGLTGMENEHPQQLSVGQQQRLAIGCALAVNPDILILDEPTKGLNARERHDLVNELKGLQEQGKTIIVISHDLSMVARTSNNILVMDHGKLVAEGATSAIMQDSEFFKNLGLPLPW